jgi:5-methylcytosine-specific restriction enzyme A
MSFLRECVLKPLTRSGGWWSVRARHLERQPTCRVCGRKTRLEVHHIKDYSTYPELELDPANLITLCRNGTQCHLAIGHLGDWKRANSKVAVDAAYLNRRYTTEPGAEPEGEQR